MRVIKYSTGTTNLLCSKVKIDDKTNVSVTTAQKSLLQTNKTDLKLKIEPKLPTLPSEHFEYHRQTK